MGRYRKLSHRLYTGSLARRLRKGARPSPQALAPYLVGCEHGNMIGLYRLPVAYIAADLGWPFEGSSETLRRLSEEGFVRWDKETERVWVVDLFRHEFETDRKETDVNSAKAVAGILAEGGKSFLVKEFCEIYRPSHQNLLRLFEGPSETLPGPFEGSLASARARPDPEPDPDPDQEQEPRETSSLVGVPDGTSDAPSDSDRIKAENGMSYSYVDDDAKADERVARNGHTKELRWRVEQVWRAHLRARTVFWQDKEFRSSAPGSEPTLTGKIRKLIGESLKRFKELAITDRDEWKEQSKTRAAGWGLFFDPWCTADPRSGNDLNDGGQRYLESFRAWSIIKGKDNTERFAELYFEVKQRQEGASP